MAIARFAATTRLKNAAMVLVFVLMLMKIARAPVVVAGEEDVAVVAVAVAAEEEVAAAVVAEVV
jgi:hypothetical protein